MNQWDNYPLWLLVGPMSPAKPPHLTSFKKRKKMRKNLIFIRGEPEKLISCMQPWKKTVTWIPAS